MGFLTGVLIRLALTMHVYYALYYLLHVFIEEFWFIAMATKAHEGHIIAESVCTSWLRCLTFLISTSHACHIVTYSATHPP